MLVGVSVFGYVLANVGTLVSNPSSTERKATLKILLIKEFLKETKCDKILSYQVISHFQQATKLNSAFDEEKMYSRLPLKLKNEILISEYSDILSNIPIFRFITNKSIKLFLLKLLKPQVAVQGRTVVKKGKIGTDILFLVEGKFSIFEVNNYGSEKNNLGNGFQNRQNRENSVSSLSSLLRMRMNSKIFKTPEKRNRSFDNLNKKQISPSPMSSFYQKNSNKSKVNFVI